MLPGESTFARLSTQLKFFSLDGSLADVLRNSDIEELAQLTDFEDKHEKILDLLLEGQQRKAGVYNLL